MAAIGSGDYGTTPFLVLSGRLYKNKAKARELNPGARAARRAEHKMISRNLLLVLGTGLEPRRSLRAPPSTGAILLWLHFIGLGKEKHDQASRTRHLARMRHE
jgi:hypothetical protein